MPASKQTWLMRGSSYRFEEPVTQQQIRRSADGGEGEPGPLRDVEQRMQSVREVEHPEHGQLQVGDVRAAQLSIQTALAELGLAVGLQVAVPAIGIEDLEDLPEDLERLRSDERR